MAYLPPELILHISSFLVNKIDIFHSGMVCSLWRSSIPRIPTPIIISYLFFDQPNPRTSNGIYLLKNQSLAFILSLQQSKLGGKFLLFHPLTSIPIFESSAISLAKLTSGFTITKLALFHPQKKNPNSNWTNSNVNFCGCTYAVNCNTVYLVNQGGLERLNCVNPSSMPCNSSIYKKRFVVSDGDLYLVFNLSACVKPNSDQQCRIYKLVMDDLKSPVSYSIERVMSLGDRALFFNWNFSFSVGTGYFLPYLRPFLANRILISRNAFCSCRCCMKVKVGDGDDFRVYSPRGKFIRTFRSTLGMFQPPPMWTHKLTEVAEPDSKV